MGYGGFPDSGDELVIAKDDEVLGMYRSALEEAKAEFCRNYEAWASAEHAGMTYKAIQELWEEYVNSRETWLALC